MREADGDSGRCERLTYVCFVYIHIFIIWFARCLYTYDGAFELATSHNHHHHQAYGVCTCRHFTIVMVQRSQWLLQVRRELSHPYENHFYLNDGILLLLFLKVFQNVYVVWWHRLASDARTAVQRSGCFAVMIDTL